MISSRKIEDLTPVVAMLAKSFIAECKKQGIDILITSTYRDFASQNALYAQGRSMPGNIVTNAKGGQSYHNFRVAFDFVPLIHGKPAWNNARTFTKCGNIAENLGLEWAGRWEGFKEMAHCQFTDGMSLRDLQKTAVISHL